jgi:tetratricopeptide (TPR) repeat protein
MNSVFNIGLKGMLAAALLLLAACGGSPDTRAKPLIDAENALNSGTNAYYNDEHKRAAEQFLRALRLYQSIDHHPGIIVARINLTETAIATGNYSGAEEQIELIQELLPDSGSAADETRMRFLQVRLLFQQERYSDAIDTLQPLLPSFDSEQKAVDPMSHSLNAIASMARLAIASNSDDAGLWINRLAITLDNSQTPSTRYHALLLRLKASQQTDAVTVRKLLDEALALYKQQSYRRGIAASLQQMSMIEVNAGNSQEAIQLLERALRIHAWTLNRKGSRETLGALIELHQSLGYMDKVEDYREQLSTLDEESS